MECVERVTEVLFVSVSLVTTEKNANTDTSVMKTIVLMEPVYQTRSQIHIPVSARLASLDCFVRVLYTRVTSKLVLTMHPVRIMVV